MSGRQGSRVAAAQGFGVMGSFGRISFGRITFDPANMDGRACIRGLRIPVSVIVKMLAYRATRDEVLADYPELEPEDVQQALEYAAWLSQEEVRPASRPMRFLADMGVSRRVVDWLRNRGDGVVHAAERGA